jgi:hypothetical protein
MIVTQNRAIGLQNKRLKLIIEVRQFAFIVQPCDESALVASVPGASTNPTVLQFDNLYRAAAEDSRAGTDPAVRGHALTVASDGCH